MPVLRSREIPSLSPNKNNNKKMDPPPPPSTSTPPAKVIENFSPSPSPSKHTPNSIKNNNNNNNSSSPNSNGSHSRRRSLRLSSKPHTPEQELKNNVSELVNNVLEELRVSDSEKEEEEREGSRKRGKRRSGERAVKRRVSSGGGGSGSRVLDIDYDRIFNSVKGLVEGGKEIRVLDLEEERKEGGEGDGWLSLRSGARVARRGESESREKEKGKGVMVVKEEEGGEEGGSGGWWRRTKYNTRRFTIEEKGKGVLKEDDGGVGPGGVFEKVDLNVPVRGEEAGGNEGLGDDDDDNNNVGGRNVGVGVEESFAVMAEKLMVELRKKKSEMGTRAPENRANVVINNHVGQNRRTRMDQFKEIARRRALDYAHFNARDEEEVEEEGEAGGYDEVEVAVEQPAGNVEDWPGPFSTAMKIIRDREKNAGGQAQTESGKGGAMSLVSWTPKRRGDVRPRRAVPALQDMCLSILVQNVDAISSLDGVPDVLRHRLSQMVCDSRRMNKHFLDLLLQGSPTEIRLADCSWLEEEQFENAFEHCDTSNLTV